MATFQLVLLNTYKKEGGIWEPRTFYLFRISLLVITWIQTIAANGTPYIMKHSHSCWSCTVLSSMSHTVCVGIWGALARWSSHGAWSIFWGKLLLHLTARSTKSRWFDRSHELEFLLALGWLVSAQLKEPPWDPVQKCQNLHTKMKSNHKYYLSRKYSAFTFSPPVAADVCTLQGLCFSLSGKGFE